MTTIAYKDGLIACDSRQTRGDRIVSDNCSKCTEVDGVRFFLAGTVCDEAALIAAYFGTPSAAPVESSGYAADNGVLMLIGHDENGIWKQVLDLANPDAIGTGAPYALTAMDMGASAEQSIAAAARRDIYTGGAVKVYSLVR